MFFLKTSYFIFLIIENIFFFQISKTHFSNFLKYKIIFKYSYQLYHSFSFLPFYICKSINTQNQIFI